MKRICTYALAAALPLAALPAKAEVLGPNWYAGVSGDVTWMSRANTGYGGNAALGFRFWPTSFGAARLEGELGYHQADGKRGFGDSHYYTYMGNAYYDFNMFNDSGLRVTPYVGAGLGATTARLGGGGSDTAFAYQFMAGFTFHPSATPNTDWSLGYRYQGSDDVGNGNRNLSANSLELGIRFHF